MVVSFKKSLLLTEEKGEMWVTCRISKRPIVRFDFPFRRLKDCFYHVLNEKEAYEKCANMFSQYCGSLKYTEILDICRNFVITPTSVRNCCRGKNFRNAKARTGNWGGARRTKTHARALSLEEQDVLSEKWKEAVREAVRARSLAKFSIYVREWSRIYGKPWPPAKIEERFISEVLAIERLT